MPSLSEKDKRLLRIWIVVVIVGGGYIVWSMISNSIDNASVSEETARNFESLFTDMANLEKQKNRNMILRKKIGNETGEFIGEKDVSQLISEIGEIANRSNVKVKGYYPSINKRTRPLETLEMKIPVECRFEQLITFLDRIREANILMQPTSMKVNLKDQNSSNLDVQLVLGTYLLDSKSKTESPMKTIAGVQQ